MATHSSVLAWRIPGTGEPGGLLSLGSHRVGHDWNGSAAARCMVISCDPLYISGVSHNFFFFSFFLIYLDLSPRSSMNLATGFSIIFWFSNCQCFSQFSCTVVFNSLGPHWLQIVRVQCPAPTPGACSNSCPSSQLCHPTFSSSVIPFSSCLQSFPASESFPMSQFSSGGLSIKVSASASVLPITSQDWFPLGFTGFTSLLSKGFSRVFSNTTVQKHQFFDVQLFYSPTLTSIHDYWKKHSFD